MNDAHGAWPGEVRSRINVRALHLSVCSLASLLVDTAEKNRAIHQVRAGEGGRNGKGERGRKRRGGTARALQSVVGGRSWWSIPDNAGSDRRLEWSRTFGRPNATLFLAV